MVPTSRYWRGPAYGMSVGFAGFGDENVTIGTCVPIQRLRMAFQDRVSPFV